MATNSYSVVDGFINNVRLWPGKDGRKTFYQNIGERLAAFVARVPREVAKLRVRAATPKSSLLRELFVCPAP